MITPFLNDNPRPPLPAARALPEILAPAGGVKSFLAALAAGADAVYCGCKAFSARQMAENFTIDELARLTRLAHDQGVKVYIALNTLLKNDELTAAGRLVDQLGRCVKPDALIIQDLAAASLARQAGFSGGLHLSTLAGVTFPEALRLAQSLSGIQRVVLPREFSIDEIKIMAAACPPGLSLEVFVHGALCYAVSGRCYWSSYMGGKSGLRGRCVQPCRRIYRQGGQSLRFFSCRDLWVDVLTKILAAVPQIVSLKIEGRKKGPHYVYYTVMAYRLLRDHPQDPHAKKTALAYLAYALGRKGTHYNLLSQRPQDPIDAGGQTGSGLLVGSIKGGGAGPWISPRDSLLAGDTLRVGCEDDPWHFTLKITRYVPKHGRFALKPGSPKPPPAGAPVFIIDRWEADLAQAIGKLETALSAIPLAPAGESRFTARLPKTARPGRLAYELRVMREITATQQPARSRTPSENQTGLWIGAHGPSIPLSHAKTLWCWLPPVVWPGDQEALKARIAAARKAGCARFVLNGVWQRSFFPEVERLALWAGPFCNIANALAIMQLARWGFSGAIVSPEMGKEDYLALPAASPLPLGVVISGNWPLCISRTLAPELKTDTVFDSPRGEGAFARRYGPDVWVFPNWRVDLVKKRDELLRAGYQCFVHLEEPLPRHLPFKEREGLWNWEVGLR